jgi:hypothetical protein
MIISRLTNPDPRIPENLRETYAHLVGLVLDTLGALDELTVLFDTSDEVIDLLNQTAPAFFGRYQHLLSDYVILSISRLTDDKRTGGRKNPQENLTLGRLLDLDEPEHHELRVDLTKKLTVIKAEAKPVQLFRHKVLAHTDRVHCLSPSVELGAGVTLESMKNLLSRINDYLVAFSFFFTQVDTPLHCPAHFGDATDLLKYLRLAVDAEEKENTERRRALS